jgi:hypothetical protein
MNIAAVLFLLAALGGAVMAALRFSGRPYPPLWLALGHGAIAASGLGTLAYTALTQTIPFLGQVALGLFCLTAVGGFVLLVGFHLRNVPLPIPFVLGHATLAVVSLLTLAIAIFG